MAHKRTSEEIEALHTKATRFSMHELPRALPGGDDLTAISPTSEIRARIQEGYGQQGIYRTSVRPDTDARAKHY